VVTHLGIVQMTVAGSKKTVLVVDDDEEIRSQLKWALSDEYDPVLAQDRPSAVEMFGAKKPMVVLLDLGLPPNPVSPEEGLAAIGDLLAIDKLVKIIVVTGQTEKQNALRAIGAGASDFLCKPIDVEEMKIILRRAFYVAQLEREYRLMQQRLDSGGFEGMLGNSRGMQEVFAAIRKVATTDAPVLILGESGTGKEMAALAIHKRSARKDGPFVPINCSAIPETLLESELFGHEKGAFTGAHTQRKGRIESAVGGTLFLDEIGDLPLAIQVKLLRFLQERTIERVGGRTRIEIDTRVVAATNTDLQKAVAEGKFREDLYYRLAVVVIRIPPLRDRVGDIPLLARAFLKRFTAESGDDQIDFSPSAFAAMQKHAWPGNVRELENRVRRAVIMTNSARIDPVDLELAEVPEAESVRTLQDARQAAEREAIQVALNRHGGKIAPAAAELQISRPTLYELMDKLGIPRPRTEGKESAGD